MTASNRRVVAFIAASIISGHTGHEVYDGHQRKHYSITGKATSAEVNVYDHESRTHYIGHQQPDGLGIYNYQTRKYIQLIITNSEFSGYDFASTKHFQGTVHGTMINLNDHQDFQHYHYSI